jgi:hypothetical protein
MLGEQWRWMAMMWGLLIAMVGVLFVWWGRSRSEFVVYRLLVARSRILWGSSDRVHGFYQRAGVAMMVFGAVLAIAV